VRCILNKYCRKLDSCSIVSSFYYLINIQHLAITVILDSALLEKSISVLKQEATFAELC